MVDINEKLESLIKEAQLLYAMMVVDDHKMSDDMVIIVQDLIWLHKDINKYE